MTEDHLGDPNTVTHVGRAPSTDRAYERFAEAWRLPKDNDEATSQTAGDDREVATHFYTLDGMNWEAGNECPIVCVSVQVMRPG